MVKVYNLRARRTHCLFDGMSLIKNIVFTDFLARFRKVFLLEYVSIMGANKGLTIIWVKNNKS